MKSNEALPQAVEHAASLDDAVGFARLRPQAVFVRWVRQLTMPDLHAHNGVVRRWLFALLFCFAWAASVQVAPGTSDAIARIAAADTPAPTGAGAPDGDRGSDRHWIAGNSIIVASTDTNRKRSTPHAGISTAAPGDASTHALTVRPPDRSGLHRSAHLRHVPLLI